ncbi:hypothetical protein SCA03_33590 [Streptomyces cacaoi]|uniref:Uncharacterized protein n=1 Tax=Streptomyces cacaoi TaxID=1898 RepID=A0A4Y3R281_STRCI|nr:hypothetical protein SCA03_33590 [Streptomyces cacaoi]
MYDGHVRDLFSPRGGFGTPLLSQPPGRAGETARRDREAGGWTTRGARGGSRNGSLFRAGCAQRTVGGVQMISLVGPVRRT